MRMALVQGGGNVGVARSFLGVRGVLGGGKGVIVDGGVVGLLEWSINDCTYSSLLLDSVGEGARGRLIGGITAGLGVVMAGRGIRVCGGRVSTPEEDGKLLSSSVTSLDKQVEWVRLSQSW